MLWLVNVFHRQGVVACRTFFIIICDFVVEFDDEKGWHRVTNGKATKCSHCQEEFQTKKSFDEHHIEKHPGLPWICQICNKEKQDKKAYYRHIYLRHNRPFACSSCNYKSDTVKKIIDHVKLNHVIYNGFHIRKIIEKKKCHYCNELYETISQYFDHHAQAHPDQLYVCCDNTYSYKNNYKIHRRKFHSKKFVCDVCKYTTATQEMIEQHVRENHPENDKSVVKGFHKKPDLGQVKCGYCSEVFFTDSTASLHHRSVHKGLPNKCSQCEKTFKSRTSLNKHIYAAHKKPFACNICDFRTYSSSNILNHVDKHRRDGDQIKGKQSKSLLRFLVILYISFSHKVSFVRFYH